MKLKYFLLTFCLLINCIYTSDLVQDPVLDLEEKSPLITQTQIVQSDHELENIAADVIPPPPSTADLAEACPIPATATNEDSQEVADTVLESTETTTPLASAIDPAEDLAAAAPPAISEENNPKDLEPASIVTTVNTELTLISPTPVPDESIVPCPIKSNILPDFTHDFKSYMCPGDLGKAVIQAMDTALSLGRMPILICDIDSTLVKDTPGYLVATELYKNLRNLGAISKAHGVIALTARPTKHWDVVGYTKRDLSSCVPEFYACMSSQKNLGGLTGKLDKANVPFLYDPGLIVMGDTGISKRKILDIYFEKILTDQDKLYELIFIDDLHSWFEEFCTSGSYRIPRILKGHSFHYDWPYFVGERIPGKDSMVSFTLKKASTFFGQDVYIVGNIPELGNWDPSNALLMDCQKDSNDWCKSLKLPSVLNVEYKYLKVHGKKIEWLHGSNLRITTCEENMPRTDWWKS